MPYARGNGASLYYEESGTDFPLVFVHEFGGDYRSWEPQVRFFFSRRYRCVAYNARGYPPSDVPKEQSAYSQTIATDDLVSNRIVDGFLATVDAREGHAGDASSHRS